MPEIVVEKIVYPGKSLGRLEGVACLTDEGLPGERVEVEPRKERPRLVEAHTTRVLHRSPRRIEPRCGHYRACSPYQIMDEDLQREIKRDQLGEILAGEAAGLPPILITASPRSWNYRRRARFHVLWTPRGARPAYNVPGTRDEFLPVDVCHLLAPPLSDLIVSALRAFPGPAPALREIEARVGAEASSPLLIFHWSVPPGPKDLDPVLSGLLAGSRPAGVVNVFSKKGRDEEVLVWGRDWIEEKAGAATFRIGARTFFQVNPSILPAVIAVMAEALNTHRSRRLADLYCGLGLFGLALAPLVDSVAAVESDPQNVRLLRENAVRQGARGVTVYDGRAQDWMGWILERGLDAAIVDPPRKGLDAALVKELAARPVPLVLYLSCNPTTLARDLKMMRPSYRPILIQGFDFFPQTPHIETLAILERK
ncbi:MAG: methyltransferase [Candidatus Aminicenantales bacterium]|jgi:23S rRNA (uracil1939-C5)-methyltransferase